MALVDLVKAVDTVNHDILMGIPEWYGSPPMIQYFIIRMYIYLKVVLNLNDPIREEIYHIPSI